MRRRLEHDVKLLPVLYAIDPSGPSKFHLSSAEGCARLSLGPRDSTVTLRLGAYHRTDHQHAGASNFWERVSWWCR